MQKLLTLYEKEKKKKNIFHIIHIARKIHLEKFSMSLFQQWNAVSKWSFFVGEKLQYVRLPKKLGYISRELIASVIRANRFFPRGRRKRHFTASHRLIADVIPVWVKSPRFFRFYPFFLSATQDETRGAKRSRTEATNKSVLRSANETVETREREISFCCAGRTLTHFIRYYSPWVFARAAADFAEFPIVMLRDLSFTSGTFLAYRMKAVANEWNEVHRIYNPCYQI